MEIWHLKDAAQIVPLALTFGQRIYSELVISLGKHPLTPSFRACTTSRALPHGKREEKWEKHPKKNCFGAPKKTRGEGTSLGSPPHGGVLMVPRVGVAASAALFLVGRWPSHSAGVTSECW